MFLVLSFPNSDKWSLLFYSELSKLLTLTMHQLFFIRIALKKYINFLLGFWDHQKLYFSYSSFSIFTSIYTSFSNLLRYLLWKSSYQFSIVGDLVRTYSKFLILFVSSRSVTQLFFNIRLFSMLLLTYCLLFLIAKVDSDPVISDFRPKVILLMYLWQFVKLHFGSEVERVVAVKLFISLVKFDMSF